MIEVAVLHEEGWPGADWEFLAQQAVSAAIAHSPYAAFATDSTLYEVAVKLTDDDEVHQLNRAYREKDKPTNVLSFPMLERDDLLELSTDGPPEMLGDLALAYETCASEARDKNVSLSDHTAHLIVHGLLHLAGHDHVDSDEQAEAMEALEIAALAKLGIADPYGDRN